jgi:hypothetical protein
LSQKCKILRASLLLLPLLNKVFSFMVKLNTMKRALLRLLFLVAGLSLGVTTRAQYVTIPDVNFINWLDTSGFHQCLSGNQLDTTCAAVVNAGGININNVVIRDLTGIQYFDNLTYLYCRGSRVAILPALPPLVASIDALDNDLTALPPLPSALKHISCRQNQLTSLPALPPSLISLDCIGNAVTALPALPATLTLLDCSFNSITNLPILPAGLQIFNCRANHLSDLPVLPASITDIDCSNNTITTLPVLPFVLKRLNCGWNQLHNLPALPTGLNVLACGLNFITALPELPTSLTHLYFNYNEVTHLPFIPKNVVNLNCSYNNLNFIGELPDSLYEFSCHINTNLTCLPQFKRIVNLQFDSTNISCLPNYGNVTNSSPWLSHVPLCGIYNLAGCPSFSNVSGKVFYDANTNCTTDVAEVGCGNVKVKLYQNGVLKQQTYTGGEGYYSFEAGNGNYTIIADTFALPFTIGCPTSGYCTSTISVANQQDYSNNFSLKCREQGFDAGVTAVVRDSGLFRPANYALVKFMAGDLSNFYGAQCAAGESGQVQVVFTGPATYKGYAAGSLPPSVVAGNTLTWNVSDFASINYSTAFHIRLQIDTTAQPHQFVYFTVTVTSTGGGDINLSNNNLTAGIEVTVPYDPNIKEVFPAGNIDVSQEWLTYTIHFQNTGTAEAQNVYIDDTLDTNLDASTFQLLAYSHPPLVQTREKTIRFNFPNINLPDSNTNEPGSHGYVQYRIKLKNSLPIGTTINNTAFIYFDFNPPVITNTATNIISTNTDSSSIPNPNSNFSLSPNPATSIVTITVDQSLIGSTATVTDITGRAISNYKLEIINTTLQTESLPKGVYLVTITSNNRFSTTKKLIISH